TTEFQAECISRTGIEQRIRIDQRCRTHARKLRACAEVKIEIVVRIIYEVVERILLARAGAAVRVNAPLIRGPLRPAKKGPTVEGETLNPKLFLKYPLVAKIGPKP